MNEDPPFTIHGDEPVEARIVSWVLGEASAFEAAELERLCEERPELLVFRRRMRALHGLLTAAEAAEPDDAWRLPPEKRKALDEIFGQEKVKSADPLIEKRISRNGRRALLAIAACLVLTVVVAGLIAPASMRQRKSAERSDFRGMIRESAMEESSGLVPLRTKLPAELIEGTPKPMKVPNLEPAAQGPAGSGSWSRNYKLSEGKPLDGERNVANNGEVASAPQGRVAVSGQVSQAGEFDIKDGLTLGEAIDSAGGVTEFGSKKRVKVRFRDGSLKSLDLGNAEAQYLKLAPGDVVDVAQKTLWGAGGAATNDIQGNQEPASAPAPSRIRAPLGLDSLADPFADTTAVAAGKPAVKAKPAVSAKPSSGVIVSEMNGRTEHQATAHEYFFRGGRDLGEAKDEAFGLGGEDELQADATLGTGWGGSANGGLVRDLTASDEAGEVPAMGDMPALGRLFDGRDRKRDSQAPAAAAAPTNVDAIPPAPSLALPDDVVRSNSAVTYEHAEKVDQVRRDLYVAEGNYNLGKFDEAKREYENALRKDPYNSAARRGLEKIASAKSDYYRAAYDQTRAELLMKVDDGLKSAEAAGEKPADGERMAGFEGFTIFGDSLAETAPSGEDARKELLRQVDAAWDLEVPADGESAEKYGKEEIDGFANYGSAITDVSKDQNGRQLEKAIKVQQDKVEERRKALASLVRTKGVIYKGMDSFYGASGVDEDQGARNALQTYHQIEQEKMQLESQVTSLLKYDSDQLMVYASGLDLPDNIIRELYPQYLEQKRKLEGLKTNGLGDRNPSVISAVDNLNTIKRQLDEGVVNLRKTLGAQLDLATNRLKKVEAMKEQTHEEGIKRGLDAQDYVDAKREFEEELELLEKMQRQLQQAAPASKQDFTKLMEEIAASEDPYSTFSLNISDASFQVAQAALAKGEQPDPAGIKVEQFYNAVDYGDPAPSANEPVAVNIEQSAHPVVPGRNLVRIALKTAAAGRIASQPLRLTLLVDQSGSMVREDRRAAMDKALAGLSKLLTKNDLVTVIGFSRSSRLLADGMAGDQAGKLADLVNQGANEGGTNLEEAIRLAGQLAERRKFDGAQNRIVLFTDGAANLGNADPERLAEKVKQLRQKGIAFDIAGIAAEDLNDSLLGELARNGNGRYYVVGKGGDDNFAKQLAGAFHPAAENVKVQVCFNPQRVGHYKLIGFEKDRLKTEDFRNDAVDAAELAAEEAGVAIYQVEPLPGGSGEIGEVSVRFRDAASGEMVERSWTIPHDSTAPVIDRASPSMQLAVLSMLAGEKLKGGPLAEAIDFQQLTGPCANVRQYYGNNGRVAEMLQMVDALK